MSREEEIKEEKASEKKDSEEKKIENTPTARDHYVYESIIAEIGY